MAFTSYSPQEHDFAKAVVNRLGGDEQAVVRAVQAVDREASYDNVRDGLLKFARNALKANPAFGDAPASELAALDEEQIYSALRGAVAQVRQQGNGEELGR